VIRSLLTLSRRAEARKGKPDSTAVQLKPPYQRGQTRLITIDL